MAWNLFFIAQQEVIGQQNGEDIYGYKLGPEDQIVQLHQVVDLIQVGANHLILYPDAPASLADKVKDWAEFRGFGYIDMAMRLGLGLGNITLGELKYMTGAHWYVGGEWHFGDVKDWEAAGSPSQVWFGKLRDILGIDLQ